MSETHEQRADATYAALRAAIIELTYRPGPDDDKPRTRDTLIPIILSALKQAEADAYERAAMKCNELIDPNDSCLYNIACEDCADAIRKLKETP